MPAGLDGNPNPLQSPARDVVLDRVVAAVFALDPGRRLVAVDGRSGSGKSTFADEVARRIEGHGHHVVRSTTDSFHRPRDERLAAGPTSPEGYVDDSHQLDTIVSALLSPFLAGSSQVRTAAFDEPTDTAVETWIEVPDDSILIFDGLFLLRAELAQYWQLTVYLDADQRLDQRWLDYLLGGLPDDPTTRADTLDDRLERARWPRYRRGWQRYVELAQPRERADLVIDNNEFGEPLLVAR